MFRNKDKVNKSLPSLHDRASKNLRVYGDSKFKTSREIRNVKCSSIDKLPDVTRSANESISLLKFNRKLSKYVHKIIKSNTVILSLGKDTNESTKIHKSQRKAIGLLSPSFRNRQKTRALGKNLGLHLLYKLNPPRKINIR